jgi:hypothetical protein
MIFTFWFLDHLQLVIRVNSNKLNEFKYIDSNPAIITVKECTSEIWFFSLHRIFAEATQLNIIMIIFLLRTKEAKMFYSR